MIKTILVATDGSRHAQKAVSLATDLARRYSAHLIVVHALMTNATSATLRKLADRKALTKEQRNLLRNYEIDAYLVLAASGGLEGGGTAAVPAPIELLEPIGRQIVGRAQKAARQAGVKKVSTAVLAGDPADSIVATAKRMKADLVVLGTRGYGDLKGFLLGSVSHKVAARAHCPVLTAK